MAMEEEEEIEEYATSETNFEKYIGENLFGKIGILIFIIGIGFFVKYAIDQNWINETARTLMGYAVGAGSWYWLSDYTNATILSVHC